MKRRYLLPLIAVALIIGLFAMAERDWRKVTPEAPFGIRDTAQPFLFNGRMWLSNGYLTNEVAYRDLWSTNDGRRWRRENDATPYDKYSGIAVLNGHIYAAKNSVWRSKDGKEWTKLTDSGPTDDKDALPMMREFKGRLWFFAYDNVLSSKDGVSWERHQTPPYGVRSSYSVTVFKDALWVIGGGIFGESSDPPGKQYPTRRAVNEVWRSADGNTWQKMPDAPWEPRMWPSTVIHRGEIYLVGGFSNVKNENFNDVWKTRDGERWEKVETRTTFTPRHWVSLWSKDRSLFMAAGNAWPLMNDVWVLR